MGLNVSSVLLLSGGLDSAVCLMLARPARALFVNYGQPHLEHERRRAVALAEHHQIELWQAEIFIPGWGADTGDPAMVVPGRNLVLVSLAATLGSPVMIGCNADDYRNYLDCRPEFFGVLRPIIDVRTPLIGLTKPEIGRLATENGLSPEETWSCYYPNGDFPCGECDACKGRAAALA